jgi:hypothetical protein
MEMEMEMSLGWKRREADMHAMLVDEMDAWQKWAKAWVTDPGTVVLGAGCNKS